MDLLTVAEGLTVGGSRHPRRHLPGAHSQPVSSVCPRGRAGPPGGAECWASPGGSSGMRCPEGVPSSLLAASPHGAVSLSSSAPLQADPSAPRAVSQPQQPAQHSPRGAGDGRWVQRAVRSGHRPCPGPSGDRACVWRPGWHHQPRGHPGQKTQAPPSSPSGPGPQSCPGLCPGLTDPPPFREAMPAPTLGAGGSLLPHTDPLWSASFCPSPRQKEEARGLGGLQATGDLGSPPRPPHCPPRCHTHGTPHPLRIGCPQLSDLYL